MPPARVHPRRRRRPIDPVRRGPRRVRWWRFPGGQGRRRARGHRRWRDSSRGSPPSWSCRRRLSGSRRRSSGPLSDLLGALSQGWILSSPAVSPRSDIGCKHRRPDVAAPYRRGVSRETAVIRRSSPRQGADPRPGTTAHHRRRAINGRTACSNGGRCRFQPSMGYLPPDVAAESIVSRSRAGRARPFGRFAEDSTLPMTLLLAAVGAVVTALLELTVGPYLRIGDATPEPGTRLRSRRDDRGRSGCRPGLGLRRRPCT